MSSKKVRSQTITCTCLGFVQTSPYGVQAEFSDLTTPCIVYDVVITQIYSLVCTYALYECCFLLRSGASDGVSTGLHLNLHESVHVLCENNSLASGLIVHRRLIVVPCFVYCYNEVPDDHCFFNSTETHVPVRQCSLRI